MPEDDNWSDLNRPYSQEGEEEIDQLLEEELSTKASRPFERKRPFAQGRLALYRTC